MVPKGHPNSGRGLDAAGASASIRPCPYEPGSYFVREPDGKVTIWVVGSCYRLIKVLGAGSFSCVVLAEDTQAGQLVALKRVGDVLLSSENAKRVLREVCILRRLSHPHVIPLLDVFVKPAQTGKCFFRGGKLVPASVDLYLVLEYMDQGDLFSLRGQLSGAEVRDIMWQLLTALQYLHANDVWHRDLKSANVLVTWENGVRVVKVADFGSARSAHTRSLLLQRTGADVTASRTSPAPPTAAAAPAVRPVGASGVTSAEAPASTTPAVAAAAAAASRSVITSPGKQAINGSFVPPQDPRLQLLPGSNAQPSSTAPRKTLTAVPAGAAADSGAAAANAGSSGPGELDLTRQPRRSSLAAPAPQSTSDHDELAMSSGAAPSAAPTADSHQSAGTVAAPAVVARSATQHYSGTYAPPHAHRQSTDGSDLVAKPSAGPEGGFRTPLTRTVCTPCYRAPEVVMSRGEYSSAMDMWSLGCIFGELLQRVAYLGSSAVPALKVAPVFQMLGDGLLCTPADGQQYAQQRPGSTLTHVELESIFDVIGTPAWASIQAVPTPQWRNYLSNIPARASRLYRRFSSMAGDVAVDLLARMLSFDPALRCGAEEAMSHEYFQDLRDELELMQEEQQEADKWQGTNGLRVGLEAAAAAASGARQGPPTAAEATVVAAVAAGQAMPGPGIKAGNGVAEMSGELEGVAPMDMDQPERVTTVAVVMPVATPATTTAPVAGVVAIAAPAATNTTAANVPGAEATGQLQLAAGKPKEAADRLQEAAGNVHLRFYEALDPSLALAVLEDELSAAAQAAEAVAGVGPVGAPGKAGADRLCEVLREMLERECDMHATAAATAAAVVAAAPDASATSVGAAAALEHAAAATAFAMGAASNMAAAGATEAPAPVLGVAAAVGSSSLRSTQRSASPGPSGSGATAAFGRFVGRRDTARGIGGYNSFRDSGQQQHQGWMPDTGVAADPSVIGMQRIPHHADSELAKLEPEKHLRPNRHGDWAGAHTLDAGLQPGPQWGVALSHDDEATADPRMMAAIRKQQAR